MTGHCSFARAFVGLALGAAATLAVASTSIQFDPDGSGSEASVTVQTFDWIPGNTLFMNGNPGTGLVPGSKMTVFSHARLGVLLDPVGAPIALPANMEFTFVEGFPATVVSSGSTIIYALDPAPADPQGPNYFEIWTSFVDSDMLAGTGFNNSKRILFGAITAATGNSTTTSCSGGGTTAQFDQSPDGINNYPGITTICSVGSNDVSINIISADADYFPGFTPALIATIKAFINSSNVTPFRQANPSRLFVSDDAGADGSTPGASIAANIGTVNGLPVAGQTLDFQTQADPNQSFEQGTIVAGACRVTYGGNDKNGNIDLTKFGAACSSDKGNKQNCYTFGGQVGAPTANPAFGGPFGEHTHHQVQGPAGDFVFHAGTHSAPKSTRITATACKDPGACRQAEANAGFKQIDFEGTGSFRTLDATATAYLAAGAGHPVLADNQDTRIYYFRVDMDDNGEPGNKASNKQSDINACSRFFAADQNTPLSIADPLLSSYASCSACADVYQFYICKDATRCEQKDAIYAVRGFLTGGNIQLHQVIK